MNDEFPHDSHKFVFPSFFAYKDISDARSSNCN